MLIEIRDRYRGAVLPEALEPGEHEVPDSVGRYLVETFAGPPLFARMVDEKVEPPAEDKPAEPLPNEALSAVETKPAYPPETKPSLPKEVKPAVRKPGRTRGPRTAKR